MFIYCFRWCVCVCARAPAQKPKKQMKIEKPRTNDRTTGRFRHAINLLMTNSSFTFQQIYRFELITSHLYVLCVCMQSIIRARPGPTRLPNALSIDRHNECHHTTPSVPLRALEVDNVVLTTVWIKTKTKPFRLSVSKIGARRWCAWFGVFGQRQMIKHNIGFCVHQTVIEQTKGRQNLFGTSVVVCRIETDGSEQETRLA